MSKTSKSKLLAQHVFFPAAALLAVIGPWLLVLSFSGKSELIISASTHAKSMLFGYVGALIAGYLVGKLHPGHMISLFGLWLAGRIAEVFSHNDLLINLLYSAFGLILAILVAPKFRAAKKWRNLTIFPLIILIGCFPFFYWLSDTSIFHINLTLHSFILFISLLMFFMGGRLITPVLTRAFIDSGMKTPQRVQPHLEGMTMILLALASVLSLTSLPTLWIAIPSVLASFLILARIYRWRFYSLSWRFADLWGLGIGYTWLGIGLLIFSLSMIVGRSSVSSLHIITIGALGTLSSIVILKSSAKHLQPPALAYYTIILLLSIAVICRLLFEFLPGYQQAMLGIAVSTWSICFLVVLVYTSKRLFHDLVPLFCDKNK